MSPRYSHSKLANVMFAMELNKKLKKDNLDITVNSLHPGLIKTEFEILFLILELKEAMLCQSLE
jgi:NAD(P)-dependent dehydrogenase (short-subunit alcohol dehydrogenase family)